MSTVAMIIVADSFFSPVTVDGLLAPWYCKEEKMTGLWSLTEMAKFLKSASVKNKNCPGLKGLGVGVCHRLLKHKVAGLIPVVTTPERCALRAQLS